MKKNTILISFLGGIGLLALMGSQAKGAPVLPPQPPPPPPRPPTPPAGKKPVYTPAPKPAPVTYQETPLPGGWIPAMPSAETDGFEAIRADMESKLLGDAPGTSFPFTIGNKKYLAMVIQTSTGEKRIAILQPETQF